MGLFDDLVPAAPRKGGLFDDLLPDAPSDTVAKIRQDPDFVPDPAALKAAYDRRFHVDPSKALDGIAEMGRQLFVDLPRKVATQEQAEIDKGVLPYLASLPNRGLRTAAEGMLQGTAQLGDLVRKPLQAGMDEVAARITSPGDVDLRRQMWLDRVRAEGENAAAMSPYYEGDKTFVPGAAPAASAIAGNVLDPSILVPGGKAAGVAARGMSRTAVGVAAEAAAKGGIARTAAAAVAPAVERGAAAAGRGAEIASGLIDKVQPVADTLGAVTGGLSGLGATHAAGRGSSLVLKWASKIRDSGTALRNIAGADWKSAQPIYAQLAKDVDAPVWLRRVTSTSVAPAVEATLRAGSAVAKGTAEGAAIGAAAIADDTLTPEEKGGALGQGAAFGAGASAVGRAAGGAARAEARQAHDIAVRMQRTIESGAEPSAVLGASDATMFFADNVEKLFKGAMPGGRDLKVVLQDAKQFAEHGAGNGVAFFEPAGEGGNPRIVVNIENPQADARLLHEAAGHALMDSVISSKPEILVQLRGAVDRASGGTSETYLQAASEQYAKALLPDASPEELAAYVTQQRVRSAELHGDQDAWILSEIGAEAAVRAVGGRGVLDLATPGFAGRISRFVRDRLPALGDKLEQADVGKVKKRFHTDDKTFFGPLISQALDDPQLHSSIVGGLRDLGTYRPGIDAPQERGVRVTPGEVGKQPFATLHDLGGGQKGTDFVVQTPDGRVVARPPAQVRQIARNRQKATNAAVPMTGVPAPYPDVDGTVKLRRTISGLVERSGARLGNWFYNSNFFSQTTKDLAKRLEQAIANGESLSGWYHQIGASSPDWRRSVERDYGNIEAQYKDFIPINLLITKVGNLIVRNYSLSSFQKKAAQWSARNGPASLEVWNGDVGQFTKDVQTYFANHRDGRPGADGVGEQKRDVINAFLVGRNATFEVKNPLRAALRGQDAQGLVRSYRLDRLEPVTKSEVEGFAQPSYEKQVRNLSPDVQDRFAKELFRTEYRNLFPAQRSDVDSRVREWEEKHPAGVRSETTRSPEFKKWFGNWENPKAFSSRNTEGPVSRVVGRDGAPLRVFHSTRGSFETFQRGRKSANNYGIFGNQDVERWAVFFSDSSSQADAYSKAGGKFEDGARTVPVFLDIKSPIDLRDTGFDFEGLANELGFTYRYLRNSDPWELLDGPDGKAFVEAAEKAGYDGVFFFEDTLDSSATPGTTYAVFRPEQIKSATGNRGTFDPNNPDIRFSPDATPSDVFRSSPEDVVLNLTAATGSLPGLDRLTKEAAAGDLSAAHAVQGLSVDALKHLLSGVDGVEINHKGVAGVFWGSYEPAIQVRVQNPGENLPRVLAAAERFASNFNQWEIHRRSAVRPTGEPGKVQADGSYDVPVVRLELDSPLSPQEVAALAEKTGLDGFTIDGNSIETYYAKDVHDRQTAESEIRGFESKLELVRRALGGRIRAYRTGVCRLWRYGRPDSGASVIPYERIRGDVHPAAKESGNPAALRIASRLRGREVAGSAQAPSLTPQQVLVQRRIARQFEGLPTNDLANPRVRRAYDELAAELRDQYDSIPVKVEVFSGSGEPYPNSAAMRRDVLENNHLSIYGTDAASFGPPGVTYDSHPLLETSPYKDVNGRPLLVNDLLRAVHDYYAHTMTPVQFGPLGEEAAWRNHMSMTRSPWARMALTTETRGQNSVVNFGKNAEHNRKNPKDTIFAEQKVALLDPEYSKIGDPDLDAEIDAIGKEASESRQFSPDAGDKTLTERLSEEGPARIMTTSALNILHKDSDRLPPPKEKRDNSKVAEALQLAASEQWGRVISSSDITPEEKDVIIANATEEAVAALAASGKNAYDWYTTAIEAATEVMAVIHPELRDDAAAKATGHFEDAKGARLGMMMAMAITSQNLTVALNSRFAEEQFAALKSTGRFDPSREYGEKAEPISANLALANTALDKFGWDGLDKFLRSEFTVKELSAALTEVLGRRVSIAGRARDVVNGAALFGPKIGQGFLQNLLGNFIPVTVDLWMRRTWGRWTGDVLGDGVTPERLARLVDAARSFGIALPKDIVSLRTVVRKTKSGTDYKTFSDSLSDRLETDAKLREIVVDWSEQLASEWQRKYKLLRLPVMPESAEALKSGALNADALADRQERLVKRLDQQWARLKKAGKAPAGGVDEWRRKQMEAAGHTVELDSATLSAAKPEWAKAAIVIKNQLKPVDAPSDQDRAVITEIINGVRERLEAQGKRVTNADIQAILWYPEKDLWAKLRGEKESNLKQQYDEEFLKIAESRGLGPQAREAADRVRAARGGQTPQPRAESPASGPVDEAKKD